WDSWLAQGHARAHRPCDELAFRIRHVALREPDRPPGLHNASGGDERAALEWPQEVDLQLDRGEAFPITEGRGIRDAHGGIGDVADDAAVERAHRVRVLWARVELEHRGAGLDRHRPEANELPDRRDRLSRAHTSRDAIDELRC